MPKIEQLFANQVVYGITRKRPWNFNKPGRRRPGQMMKTTIIPFRINIHEIDGEYVVASIEGGARRKYSVDSYRWWLLKKPILATDMDGMTRMTSPLEYARALEQGLVKECFDHIKITGIPVVGPRGTPVEQPA